jgi:hypothetical protein
MKLNNIKVAALALGISAFAYATPLTPISAGSTTVTVNGTAAIAGTNGANSGNAANPGQLYSVNAFGFQIYDVQDAVHDFGAQLGSDTNTFTTNYIGGAGNTPPPANFSTTSASSLGGIITTSGVFSGVFGNISWTKTYQFIANDVLQEVYTIQNNGTSAVTNFRGFTAYDPDAYSGSGMPTLTSTNKIGTASGFNYAQAAFTGLNVVLASSNPAVSIGFLPTTNMTGNCVNALISGSSGSCNTTVSPNPSAGDRAFAYAFNIASLGVGQSQSFTVYQLFGNGSFNLNNALAALPGGSSSSSSGGDGVPEPGSMFLMGSACVALGVYARRRSNR